MANGDIYLSSNFDLSSQRPLDSRSVIDTLVNRNLIPFVKRYDGLLVYVEENKHEYRLQKGKNSEDLHDNLNWVDVTIELGVTNLSSFVNDVGYLTTGSNLSLFTNDVGFITTETDPTVSAIVKAITSGQVNNWDTAYSWGNHADAGYVTALGGNISLFNNDSGYITHETDPTVESHIKAITTGNIANWNSKEPAFTKNTAFNKNFGLIAGTVAEGNHTHSSTYTSTPIPMGSIINAESNRSTVQTVYSSLFNKTIVFINIDFTASFQSKSSFDTYSLVEIPSAYAPLIDTIITISWLQDGDTIPDYYKAWSARILKVGSFSGAGKVFFIELPYEGMAPSTGVNNNRFVTGQAVYFI